MSGNGIKKDNEETILSKIENNAEVIESLLEILEKLQDAGIVDLMKSVSNNYLPTDVDFFGKFFSSKEFTIALMKTMNVLVSVMGAMGSEKNSDLIKGFMFNFETITDNVQEAVHNPKKYSPKIRKFIMDDDYKASTAILIAFMLSIGQIFRKITP
jgi:uncharacterized protein YjgD (DUF1641 family)